MREIRVLIVGAGSAGTMAVREIAGHPEFGYRPVGFIDDDPAKQGKNIEGIPVMGGRDSIPSVLAATGADEILIALPSLHGAVIRDIVETCRSERIRFRIVPGVWEIIRGDVEIEQIRGVEPEDLLGRETVEPDPEVLDPAYRGKRVLITGAGGSIGRELVRQVLPAKPARVLLVGKGENSLFETRLETPAGEHEAVLLDIRNRDALGRLFERERPEVVLHAAAHKHVTFMEHHPEEAILNNVVGTLGLLEAAEAAGTERFVMLSTDKAVHPRSVMGASKRLAELLLIERAPRSSMLAMTVRFGNVLGSRGSVVPVFQHQIRRRGPVTVSHPEVSRFFMTMKEAALLVLEAGAMGKGGEIFVLEMGEQIRILELARELITLSGLRPEVDVPIRITGLGPGEKLREELVYSFETLEPTRNPKIRSARGSVPPAGLLEAVEKLAALARAGEGAALVRELEAVLPEASLGTAAGAEKGGSA